MCSRRSRPTVCRWPRSPPRTREATRTRSTAIARSAGSSRQPLFALESTPPREPASADEWRALWARVGVSCDELSCTALTLGLRPHRLARGYLAGRLRAAARAGRPLVLTLAELRAEPPRLGGETLFVCENPSIVAAAAAALGVSLPSAALHRRLAEHGGRARARRRRGGEHGDSCARRRRRGRRRDRRAAAEARRSPAVENGRRSLRHPRGVAARRPAR